MVYGQTPLRVQSNGQVQINGGAGGLQTAAPEISINSNSTSLTGVNTALSLVNTNSTTNSWARLHFSSTQSGRSHPNNTYASLATQYRNKGANSRTADFHIATFNSGVYGSRIRILGTTDANNVRIHFVTGNTGQSGALNRGAWIENSSGQVTFRPNAIDRGLLGTPSFYWHRLYVDQAQYYNHSTIMSDHRLKKDIRNVDGNVLERMKQVRSVKYKYNRNDQAISTNSIEQSEQYEIDYTDGLSDELDAPAYCAETDRAAIQKLEAELEVKNSREQLGFIAQELMGVFPEVVDYDEEYDSYSIQYTAMIPLLVVALQEQQTTIETLTNRLAMLERGSPGKGRDDGKAKSGSTDTPSPLGTDEAITNPTTQGNAYLTQNTPNPFTNDTQIGYYLPEGVKTATLYIYNMQGVQLKSYPLYLRGEGTHTIFASELTPGMYLYTLISDGREVDTKRMILTK